MSGILQHRDVLFLAGLFWAGLLACVLLVTAPIYRFYTFGWEVRRQEFMTRLSRWGSNADDYIEYFWRKPNTHRAINLPDKPTFADVYKVINGRHLYVAPSILLVAVLVLFAGLTLDSAIRLGYDNYASTYSAISHQPNAVLKEKVSYLALGDLDWAFLPLPRVMLSLPAMAAISGAYLYVVQVVVQGYRTRTLLSSDLLWSAFRLIIALPLGASVGELISPSIAGLVGFGLGAFPIGELNKLLRRLTGQALNVNEAQNTDGLLKMNGVTPDVSALLNGEGIQAPHQLASQDPVSLAVRAGLAFDFVLNLAAQAQVWSFIGETTAKLNPTGFADARAVHTAMRTLGGEETVPADLIAVLAKAVELDPLILTADFKNIADDDYTAFLVRVSKNSDQPARQENNEQP